MTSFHARGKLLSTVALGWLVACGGDTSARVDDGRFRVALLTPGPVSDQAWNGEAYRGLLAIRDSLGAAVSHIQTRTPASFDENFREYARQGYQLVIGHGFEYKDAAERVAPAFPATVFAVTSSDVSGPNVAGIRFAFDQPSYLAGIAAGGASRTGVIGAIGGTELPPVREGFDAFAAGARAVNPQIRVLVSYVGNWDDVSAGREQALAQLAQGADVIFQNADAAGLGVFQAVREAGAARALVIGANADQNHVAPAVTLGSVVLDVPRAFLVVARTVKARDPLPAVFTLGSETGAVRFVVNAALLERIVGPARARLDSVSQAMARGAWRMPVARSAASP